MDFPRQSAPRSAPSPTRVTVRRAAFIAAAAAVVALATPTQAQGQDRPRPGATDSHEAAAAGHGAKAEATARRHVTKTGPGSGARHAPDKKALPPTALTTTRLPGGHLTRARRAALARAEAARASQQAKRDEKVDGKIALFPFRGEDPAAVERPVLETLRERGLTVITGLRPVDLAEQFRELAETLALIAYIEGSVTDVGNKTRVDVSLRSGYSGRRVASAVIIASREDLPARMNETLWERLGPAVRRARADADKPRRHTRAPMEINAGTPLDGTAKR